MGDADNRYRWPPARLGRYVIEPEPIGVGGFGVVFKAKDPRLPDRPVAVKVLRPPADLVGAVDEDWLLACRAVEAEAQLMRNLEEQHLLVNIFDIDHHRHPVHGEIPFFVMAYAERGTLRQRLDRLGRVLTADEAVALIEGVAEPLRSLSQPRDGYPNGIVHRDVKDTNFLIRVRPGARSQPAGELLAADEELVLADLGLARPIDPDAVLTSGAKGTWLWCAPEQLEHDAAVDVRADIFAATALVTSALTGRSPRKRFLPGQPLFADATLAATGPLEAELRKGLSPERIGRHATIDEWEAALLDAISAAGGSNGPTVSAAQHPGPARPDPARSGVEPSTPAVEPASADGSLVLHRPRSKTLLAGIGPEAATGHRPRRSLSLAALAGGAVITWIVAAAVLPIGRWAGLEPDREPEPASESGLGQAAPPAGAVDRPGEVADLDLGVEVTDSVTASEVDRYRFWADPDQTLYFEAWPDDGECRDVGDPGMSWRLPKQADAPDEGWFFNAYLSYPEGGCSQDDFGPITFDEGGWFALHVFYGGQCGDCAGRYSFAVWDVPAPDRFAIDTGVEVSAESLGQGAGWLESPGAVDIYELAVEAGTSLLVDHLPGGDCLDGDPGIELTMPFVGDEIQTYWDSEIAQFGTCDPYDVGPFRVARTGTLQLIYSYGDNDAGTGRYSFTVETVAPD